jgi:hypothetical protein
MVFTIKYRVFLYFFHHPILWYRVFLRQKWRFSQQQLAFQQFQPTEIWTSYIGRTLWIFIPCSLEEYANKYVWVYVYTYIYKYVLYIFILYLYVYINTYLYDSVCLCCLCAHLDHIHTYTCPRNVRIKNTREIMWNPNLIRTSWKIVIFRVQLKNCWGIQICVPAPSRLHHGARQSSMLHAI